MANALTIWQHIIISMVVHVIVEIEDALPLVAATSEELDGLKFNTEEARRNINAWKAHLPRAVNQDEARINVIERLPVDEHSVFLVQDWAMKFLPRKYRESQSNWFAKRGIPWHITVAVWLGTDQQLQSMTFIHPLKPAARTATQCLA